MFSGDIAERKSQILDGDKNTYWHSKSQNGGWFEIDSPKSQLFKSVIIITRQDGWHSRYDNICLFVDNESVPEVCTEDEWGNPLISGDEITFSIEPRAVNKELTLIFLPVVLN